jgi:hypothetical protein
MTTVHHRTSAVRRGQQLGPEAEAAGRNGTERGGRASAVGERRDATRGQMAWPPHAPAGKPGTGPMVSFGRTGLSVPWDPDFASLLELAEACDVFHPEDRAGPRPLAVRGVLGTATAEGSQ